MEEVNGERSDTGIHVVKFVGNVRIISNARLTYSCSILCIYPQYKDPMS